MSISVKTPSNISKNLSTIEVGTFQRKNLCQEINDFISKNLESIWQASLYILLHEEDARKVNLLKTDKPFFDPALERCDARDYDYVIAACLKPGTSDAVGNIALEQAMIAVDAEVKSGDQGFQYQIYYLKGELTAAELKEIQKFLFNPELYNSTVYTSAEIELEVPLVQITAEPKIETIPILEMDDVELQALNKERKLAASLEELQYFQDTYKDSDFVEKRKALGLSEEATDVELETWFGLRSEHCFHKEFNARIILEDIEQDDVFKKAVDSGWLQEKDGKLILEDGIFKTFIKRPAEKVYDALEARGNNWIASMFSDNAGVVYYDQDYMFCIKVETHNSPSNIEPVQGAKTGLNGNFRDIMGTMQGSFDILMGCFAYATGPADYDAWLPKGVKHPYVILRGITQGVREAGNEMQIPTLAGLAFFDPRYIAKCLVYCGAVGWSPVKSENEHDYRSKAAAPGEKVFLLGQAVGIDGIHGATESSLSASSEISLGHVQADFSFIQVKVKEFILAASREGLFSAVTDFGAMGLGSASHETARITGGMQIDLAKHPVKYQGIQPWQINCSETQNRMLLIIPPENIARAEKLAGFFDVDLSHLGELNDSGYIHLQYQDSSAAVFEIKRLFNSEPRKVMRGSWSQPSSSSGSDERTIYSELARPEVASKEWFFRQKDFSVKGGTILAPLYGKGLNVDSDASIQKPLDTQGKDNGAIAYAMAAAPKLSDIDPYLAVRQSYLEVLGKIIAVGGKLPDLSTPSWDAWALCGNYCQPNSDAETALVPEAARQNLGALVREGVAIAELVEEFNIPIISGKDSMKCSCTYDLPEGFDLSSVPEELVQYMLVKDGKIEIHDPPTYLVTAAVKIQDYQKCQNAEFKRVGDYIYLVGEGVDFKEVAAMVQDLIESEQVSSVAYIHAGGLAAAISKACFASQLGAEVSLAEEQIFDESPGRFLITSAEELKGVQKIGQVKENGLNINQEEVDLAKALAAYQSVYNFGGLNA